jgi:hypothetical protein
MFTPEEEGFGGEEGGLFGGGGFGEEGGGGLFGGEEEGGLGGELGGGGEEGGLGELGGGGGGEEGGGGGPDLGALEGFGADSEHTRFPYHRRPRRIVTGRSTDETRSLPPRKYPKRRIRRPIDVQAEVVTPRGQDHNIELTLGHLPLWDDADTMFGLRRRHAAKILHELDGTDPRLRSKTAKSLPSWLQRKEGLTRLQAEAATYLAMRLGYIPGVALSSDTYDALGRYVTSKMNGSGLTKTITAELNALSATMMATGKTGPDPITRLPMRERTRKQLVGEKSLSHNKLLTGETK